MKIKFTLDRMTGNQVDVTLEVERTSRAERARWDTEEAAKHRGALLAIREASASDAQAIAESVLES